SPLTPPVPTPTPPGADGCVFVDVCSGDYYYAGVAYLKVSGAVSGYVDNTFRPYNLTTRAHLAKILVTAFNITPFTGHPQTFADVPDTQPFYAVIETAAKEHMISGYACGGVGEPCDSLNRPYFRPSAEVTRGQVAKMSAGAAGWPLITPVTPTFADVPANYALYSAIETAVCHGALSGYACGGPGEPCDSQNRPYFHPGASATRGQVCKIVFNVIRSAGCAPAAP
ncbi:MAG TPA: S-layer homology domain-containing protein, partial [Chloroflexia bacterium]|nr:S-layer homology domain-containing protein [Chloroflexia bacterium]